MCPQCREVEYLFQMEVNSYILVNEQVPLCCINSSIELINFYKVNNNTISDNIIEDNATSVLN